MNKMRNVVNASTKTASVHERGGAMVEWLSRYKLGNFMSVLQMNHQQEFSLKDAL